MSIESSDDERDASNNVGSISTDVDQVLFKGVDTGGVKLILECKLIFSRNGEKSRIEGDAIKSIIESFFQEIKRSVDSGKK